MDSLVQSCCGEGETQQTNITGICGECSQCMGHTGFAPAQGMCVFPIYTAQAPDCSAGALSKVGPGFRALPRSELLRFRFSGTPQWHKLSWMCILCPVLSSSGDQVLGECTVPGGRCVLITSSVPALGFLGAQREHCLRCAVCLFWGADLWLRPSWWMSTMQYPKKTWLATESLLTVW